MYKYSKIIILLFLFSCNKKSDENTDKITALEINNIVVDHVVKNRDWCRFSHIIFSVDFVNNTKDTLYLNKPEEYDFCDFDNIATSFKLKIPDSTKLPSIWKPFHSKKELSLVLSEKNKDFFLPNKREKLSFYLKDKIFGRSLNEIKMFYEPLFSQDFFIEGKYLFINDSLEYIFRKSKQMKVEYVLDDELVNSLELEKMNYRIEVNPPPNPNN